jgi:hypothetical protein
VKPDKNIVAVKIDHGKITELSLGGIIRPILLIEKPVALVPEETQHERAAVLILCLSPCACQSEYRRQSVTTTNRPMRQRQNPV